MKKNVSGLRTHVICGSKVVYQLSVRLCCNNSPQKQWVSSWRRVEDLNEIFQHWPNSVWDNLFLGCFHGSSSPRIASVVSPRCLGVEIGLLCSSSPILAAISRHSKRNIMARGCRKTSNEIMTVMTQMILRSRIRIGRSSQAGVLNKAQSCIQKKAVNLATERKEVMSL